VDGANHVVGFGSKMEIVQNKDEASRRVGQIGQQQAGESDTLGASGQTSAQLRDRGGCIDASLERIGEPSEKAPGIAVGWLDAQPDDRRAAVAGVGRRERALTITSGRYEQNERKRSMSVEKLEQTFASKLVRRWAWNPRR